MIIRPQQKLKDKLFYNNLTLIVVIFSIICLITSMLLQSTYYYNKSVNYLNEGQIFGPIKVQNKPIICKVIANFEGENTSSYLSGEVLDENKDTLYEFGKDLWHESGYDSDGYWSESDRKMTAYLTFKDKGTYYIQFNTDENNMYNISVTFQLVKNSYVAHSKAGTLALLLAMIVFYLLNASWINEKMSIIDDKLADMSED